MNKKKLLFIFVMLLVLMINILSLPNKSGAQKSNPSIAMQKIDAPIGSSPSVMTQKSHQVFNQQQKFSTQQVPRPEKTIKSKFLSAMEKMNRQIEHLKDSDRELVHRQISKLSADLFESAKNPNQSEIILDLYEKCAHTKGLKSYLKVFCAIQGNRIEKSLTAQGALTRRDWRKNFSKFELLKFNQMAQLED
jgi:hypothetical protein